VLHREGKTEAENIESGKTGHLCRSKQASWVREVGETYNNIQNAARKKEKELAGK